MSNSIFDRLKKLALRPKDDEDTGRKADAVNQPAQWASHADKRIFDDPNSLPSFLPDVSKKEYTKDNVSMPTDPRFKPLPDPHAVRGKSKDISVSDVPKQVTRPDRDKISRHVAVPPIPSRGKVYELPDSSSPKPQVESTRNVVARAASDTLPSRLVAETVFNQSTNKSGGNLLLPSSAERPRHQGQTPRSVNSASSYSDSNLKPSIPPLHTMSTALKPERQDTFDPPSIVIIVMGLTGAGKSRFVKEATGLDVDVGHSLISATAEITPYEVKLGDRYGFLIDTPGFDDIFRTDIEIFRDVADWLARQYANDELVTSIVYVHRITDSRVAGSALRNLTVMKKMLGVESFRNLVLVTSMWDLVEADVGQQRENELSNQFWADLLRAGARMQRFEGDRRSALRVLAEMRREAPVTLTIQRELVDDHLQLNRTTAGSYLEREMLKTDAQATSDIFIHAEQLNETADNSDSIQEYVDSTNNEQQQSGSQLHGPLHNDAHRSNTLLKAFWSERSKSLHQGQPTSATHKRDAQMYVPFQWEHDFRLVELRAGSGESPIEVSLVMANVLDPPQFVALSYVVGRELSDAPINFRRGRWLSQLYVSQTLRTALQYLRLPDTDLLVWVDAISIDQENIYERARQVRMMSQIFRAAQGVCIWLGPASDGSDLAMDFIHSILNFAILEDLVKDDNYHEKWLALAKLMSRPWFRRRWVVQEIIFARDATLHCGAHVVTWADFCDAVTLFRTKWSEIQRHMGETELAELGDAHLLGAISLIEISQGVFRRDASGNVLEKLLTIETLLSLLPMFEVTDLLDTVFAILDMANDIEGNNTIMINYAQQPAELYRDTIKLIVRNSSSLDIICRPWAPQSGLPSWITTVAKHAYRRRTNRQQYDRQNGVSLVGMPGNTFYRACAVLRATPENTSFLVEGDQEVLRVTGQCIGRIQELGDKSINGNIPREWVQLAGWNVIDEPPPPSFWRTLVANRAHNGSIAPDWYGRACEFAFRKSTTDDVNTAALVRSIFSSHVQEFLNRVLDVTWRRTFALVIHQDGTRCALCPPETAIGDIVCVLFGCSVPVVLRRQVSYYQLIGECFVYGAMDGEVVSDDSAMHQVFDII